MTKLEEILLEALSFYSPMTLELILIDMDFDKIFLEKKLTLEDLNKTLYSLEKQKLLRSEGEGKAKTWVRILKKRPWYKKYLPF